MKIRTQFPHKVDEVEYLWIPLPDGTRLCARLWAPSDALAEPVPAIIDCIPYRLTDGTCVRDAAMYPYWAGFGYACLRLDLRGSGDSDGILLDEYTPQEQQDICDAIAWIAQQPWCTGAVGMTGISWGGFNSLQVAARRPPALKAIITLMSTDDRYADDVHYKGGCVSALDMLPWGASMLHYQALPPHPAVVGERWREQWLERLERDYDWTEIWLSHQRRDAYWKQGSVCEDYAAITAAVYAIGGWVDGYTDSIMRLLQGLPGPRKGLIGPWSHAWPEQVTPGPAIGFLQEALRWWDHWLKGIDTGIMDEPMLRVWMQDFVEPAPVIAEQPGRWVAEDVWPSSRPVEMEYSLNAGTLDAAPAPETCVEHLGAQLTGLDAGAWCAEGAPGDWARDQRRDDGLSVTWDSSPLAEPVEILGHPEVSLTLACDRPNALLCVRLCDVAPTGLSKLVTRNLLNLTHRDGHEHPAPLEPGTRYTVKVALDSIAHRFPAGHKLRVAVSTTYWPWAWPSPEPVTLSAFTGGHSKLMLPVRPPRPEDGLLLPFAEPEEAPALDMEVTGAGSGGSRVILDKDTDVSTLEFRWIDGGLVTIPKYGIETEDHVTYYYTVREGDPLSAQVKAVGASDLRRGADLDVHIESVCVMRSDLENFYLSSEIKVLDGGREFFSRSWEKTIPRDLV